jgi:hypothetical protein
MSLLNIASDLVTVADGLEPLVLRRTESAVETTIAHALRRPISKNESANSSGAISLADVRFHLPAEELPLSPAVDDKLIDAAGIVWIIDSVKSASCATRWECLCHLEPPPP